jgi:hypothetical protein
MVASLLIAGLAEIGHQFARTTVRVRDTLQQTRSARLAQAEMQALERADAGSLNVASDTANATIGDANARAELSPPTANGDRRMSWEIAREGASKSARSISVDGADRLELSMDGAVRLWGQPGQPPLLVVTPKREAPFNCQYDVVVRKCR